MAAALTPSQYSHVPPRLSFRAPPVSRLHERPSAECQLLFADDTADDTAIYINTISANQSAALKNLELEWDMEFNLSTCQVIHVTKKASSYSYTILPPWIQTRIGYLSKIPRRGLHGMPI